MIRAALLLIITCFVFDALARSPIVLYKRPGFAVDAYDRQVKELVELAKSGVDDLYVQFSQNRTFKVLGYLGGGNQNYIFDVGGGQAIRIKKARFHFLSVFNPLSINAVIQASLSKFYQGMLIYENNGIETVKIDYQNSEFGEFILTEKLDIDFTYGDYLDPEFRKSLSMQDLEIVEQDLLVFAENSWRFRKIGDFNSGSLAYVRGRGWVLIDASHEYEPALTNQEGNIFEMDDYDKYENMAAHDSPIPKEVVNKPGLPEYMKESVRRRIAEQRSRYSLQTSNINKDISPPRKIKMPRRFDLCNFAMDVYYIFRIY